MAVNDATSSGNDVVTATSVVPTKVPPRPVSSANAPATCASFGPAKHKTTAAAPKMIAAERKDGLRAELP